MPDDLTNDTAGQTDAVEPAGATPQDAGGAAQQEQGQSQTPRFTEEDLRELEAFRSGKHEAFQQYTRTLIAQLEQELAQRKLPDGRSVLDYLRGTAAQQQTASAARPQITNPIEELRQQLRALQETHEATAKRLAELEKERIEAQLDREFMAAARERAWQDSEQIKQLAAEHVQNRAMEDLQRSGRYRPFKEYLDDFDKALMDFVEKMAKAKAPQARPPRSAPSTQAIPEPDRLKKLDEEADEIVRQLEELRLMT